MMISESSSLSKIPKPTNEQSKRRTSMQKDYPFFNIFSPVKGTKATNRPLALISRLSPTEVLKENFILITVESADKYFKAQFIPFLRAFI
jgi:hypothetical protein